MTRAQAHECLHDSFDAPPFGRMPDGTGVAYQAYPAQNIVAVDA